VTVLGAKNLRASDFMGYSDPYCIGEVLGKPWSRTRTASVEQTCDPVWNHDWEVPDFSSGDIISFSVFDQDRKGSDFLGRTRLSFSQLESDFDEYPEDWCVRWKSRWIELNTDGSVFFTVCT